MGRRVKMPPPAVMSGRVLEYAILPKSVKHSGAQLQFVGGQPLGWVPCLAIEQDLRTGEVSLLYCSREWEPLGIHAGTSIWRAKLRAERMYPGSRSYWKRRGVTEQHVREYMKHRWDGFECSFCRRTPDDIEQLFENGTARICNTCVEEFHEEFTQRKAGS